MRREETAELRRPELPPDVAPGPVGPPPGPPRNWLAIENPWPWLLLVPLAVAGLLIWLFLFRGNGDRSTVPRVVGLSQPAAIARLNHAGFDVTALRKPAGAPAGQVVAQAPGAGSQLKQNQTVTIDVSNGTSQPASTPAQTTSQTTTSTAPAAQTVAMPDVTGKDESDAGNAVEAAGLVPDTFPVTSDTPPGSVASQVPGAGTKVALGKTVRLDVSAGSGSSSAVTIPDVVGAKAADARAKLRDAELTVRTLYRSGAAGVVLQEQPGGGGQAAAYSQITIAVGR